MKRLLISLLLLPSLAFAQFTPGQVLTAAQLNSQFALYMPLGGGTLTGPLTVPTLNTANAQITGGTIAGADASSANATATGGTTARSLAAHFSDVIYARDRGIKCDGVTDDAAAIASAFASLAANTELVFPPGVCVFKSAQTLPLISNASIIGAGSGQTKLLYQGANSTNDLITLGNGSTPLSGWLFQGFTIDSTTTMTAGAAFHVKDLANGNVMIDVNAGSLNGTNRIYNGIWLDNVNVFKYDKFAIQADNNGLLINGASSGGAGSDVYLDHGTVINSNIGYLVGGGQGGVYFGNLLAYGNNTNYQIDNSLVSNANREIFFSDMAVSDGSKNYGVYINDPLAVSSPITINAFLASAGLIGTGGTGVEVYVKSWPNGRITIGPGQLYNATSDGLKVDDASTIITIDSARHIFNNGGYGINATTANSNISNLSQYMENNTLGNYSANVSLSALRGAFDTVLDYKPGSQRGFMWTANGSLRWKWSTDGSSETGGNAGSNALLCRYNDSGAFIDCPIYAARSSGLVTFADGAQLPVTTVASLPTCNAGTKGTMYAVSDFNGTPTYNGALTGGGSTSLPVFCNGSSWTQH